MTKYKDLLQIHKYLKNDLNGSVCVGVNEEKELIVLSLDDAGNLILGEAVASSIFFGIETCAPAQKKVFIDEVVSEKIIISSVTFTGNGLGVLTLKVDDVVILKVRNSYMEPTKLFTDKFEVLKDQRIMVDIENVSFQNSTNNYDVFLFYREIL